MERLNFVLLIGFVVGGIFGLFESLLSRFSVLEIFYSIIIYIMVGIMIGLIFNLIFIKLKKRKFNVFVSSGLICFFIFLNIGSLLRKRILFEFSFISIWSIFYLISLIMCIIIAYGISYLILKINLKKVGIIFGILIFLLLILGIVVSYNPQEIISTGEINLNNPNIVLIIINSWRADHISRDITPNIYDIIQDGIYFKKCVVNSPLTTVSSLSILTGVHPYKHNIRDLGSSDFNDNITTMAEILKKNGYKTAGFVGNWPLNSRYGFDRGFDFYEDNVNFLDKFSPELSWLNIIRLFNLFGFIEGWNKDAGKVNKKINSWLEKKDETPFFLFIHYFDPHMPYEPVKVYFDNPNYKGKADGSLVYYGSIKTGKIELNKEDVKHMINLYDSEIKFVDESIRNILNKIDNENTIIIIVGDHGEGLGDHNKRYFNHGSNLYDEEIVVPLIIKYPKLSHRIIEKQVRSIDIIPTILDLVSIKKLNIMDGTSLIPLLNNELDLIAYSETFYINTIKFSIRTNKWKYILGIKGEELYNLENDPKEKINLIKENKDISEQFKNMILNTSKKKTFSSLFINEEIKIEEVDRKRLKALGYIV